MKISHLPRQPRAIQSRLFEEFDPLLSLGARRVHLGDFAEELVSVALSACRIRTDSRQDICPDLRTPDGAYIEVKSISIGNTVPLYANRFRKDQDFIRSEGATLFYAFSEHTMPMGTECTLSALRAQAASHFKRLILLSFTTLETIVSTTPLTCLNKARPRNSARRTGFGAYGYTDGYALKIKALEPFLSFHQCPRHLCVYGLPIPLPGIYADEPASRLLEAMEGPH